MAFDAEPAPSDRRSPRARRSRSARRKRGRSIFGVESLETRVLLSSGDLVPSTQPPALGQPDTGITPPPFLIAPARPDGSPPEGSLDRPPSILDSPDRSAPPDVMPAEASPKPDPIAWHLDVLAGFTGPPINSPNGEGPLNPQASNAMDHGGEAVPLRPALPPAFPPGVLLETNGVHATRASAQALPASGETEVDGRWSPGDILDLYRISMHPDTQTLRVGVQVPTPQAGSPDRLVLYDGQGNCLSDQPLPLSSSGLSVLLSALNQHGPAQTIYVGVYSSQRLIASAGVNASGLSNAAPSATLSSYTPVSYLLDVALVNNPPTSGSSGATSPPSTELPLTSTPIEPTQVSSETGLSHVSATADSSGTLATTPASLTLTQAVGTPQQAGSQAPSNRPSAWRSVAPLGGALGPRATTRSVDRRAVRFVDFDLLPVAEDVEIADTADTTTDEIQTAESLLAPHPSVGGLPMLGASTSAVHGAATAETPPIPAQHPDSSSAHALEALVDRAKVDRAQQDASELGQPAAISDCTPTEQPPTKRPRSLGLLRTGVSVAYVLAFTCLLPDLSAVFHAAGGGKRKRIRWSLLRKRLKRG